MTTIYIDADACPVKDEVYRVARRYSVPVRVVANAPIRVPSESGIELTVCNGFGAVDDWIAERVGESDIVVTADLPLAARCIEKGARVIDPKGYRLTDTDIGPALALRDLTEQLRQSGCMTGGPAPMQPKDRSRFLSRLDETVHAARRAKPSGR